MTTAYKGSAGGMTTNANGFAFVRTARFTYRASTTAPQQTMYGNYCAALAGWLQDAGGGVYTPTQYRTSGDYYNQGFAGTVGYTQGGVRGYIYTTTLYTVATSAGTGGTMSGGGDYESGQTATIKATPSSGYVVDTLNGVSQNGTSGAKSVMIAVTADQTVSATFKPYYTLKFNANGGTNAPGSLTYCFANVAYAIPDKVPTWANHQFVGWATSTNNAANGVVECQPGGTYVRQSCTARQTVTLYAAWKQYTLSYDANGGSLAPSSTTSYGSVTLAAAPSRTGRAFLGWKIGNAVYEAGATYSLTSDATAVAQWTNIAIRNTTTAWGSLSLYDTTLGLTAASSSGEWLKHTGVSGRTYRVDGTPASKLYEFRGVLQSDGSYSASHSFKFTGGDVELTVAFAEKPLCTVTLEQPAHGTARIATSADSGTNRYLKGASVEVRITPDAGWKAVSAVFVNDLTGAVSNKSISGDSVTLNGVSCDVTVKIDMKAVDYSVGAAVHDASAGAIASVSAKVGGEEADVAHYGDEVAFSATVAEGHSFAGWFDAAGRLVSADAECAVSVAGDVSLFAKAAVAVTLSVEYGDPDGAESCALKVNGADYAAGTELAVALGDSFAYELVLGERVEGADWMFDRWADADGNSLGLPQSGTYAPTAAVSMVALVAASTYRTIVVHLVRSTGADGGSFVDADDFPGAVSCAGDGMKEEKSGGEGAADPFRFTFQRTQTVRLTAAAKIGESNFQGFSSAPFSAGGAMPSEWLAGGESPCVLLDAAETTLYAWYGEPRVVSVSAGLAAVCDATMGSVSIVASDGVEVSEDGLSATVTQGASATLRAQPTNGYRFAGWHPDSTALGDPLSEEAEWTTCILVAGTFFAKFAKDVHSVCEWEGSDEPKTLTWRSKTYAASKPFSPSACRVDALGYAGDARGTLLELSVEVFSAPDAAPTSAARLSNIASQDARRLPTMRQERYLQVELRSDVEVDAVLVGTSMEGLAQ